MAAFNLGSLGFLTNCHFDEFKQELLSIIYGSQLLETCGQVYDSQDEGSNDLGKSSASHGL